MERKNEIVVGATEERAHCQDLIDQVMSIWHRGHHKLDGKPFRRLKAEYESKCDNLEGFPPFGKIPKTG